MKKLDRKSKKKLMIILISLSVGILFMLEIISVDPFKTSTEVKAEKMTTKQKEEVKQKNSDPKEEKILLDVPLESQFSDYPLNNGCEVTALSMLLQYYGYETNKNDLAELLFYVPVILGDGYRGNPHDGFVGDIYGGDLAMGADVEPVAKVAEQVVGDDFEIVQSQSDSLDSLMKVLDKKTPIWVKVTQELVIPNEYSFKYWNTTSGQVKVSPLNHAVVITGYDEDEIFVNDPYGYKDRAVSKEDFEFIFDAMGKQSLFFVKR